MVKKYKIKKEAKEVTLQNYIEKLFERSQESKIYKKFQLTGLEIASILEDEKHKALYIKLAKQMKEDVLLELAKNIAEKKDIKNKGAYFMKVLYAGKNNSRRKNTLSIK